MKKHRNYKYNKFKKRKINGMTSRQKYKKAHKKEFKKYKMFSNKELRSLVMCLLGERCAKCGYSDSRALQIDHIDGGGSKERREIGARGILIKILEHGISGYQVLCYNCGQIKRIENREDLR